MKESIRERKKEGNKDERERSKQNIAKGRIEEAEEERTGEEKLSRKRKHQIAFN